MPLIFMITNTSDPKDSELQNNKNFSAYIINPQHRFFIPDGIRKLKIPEYFNSLIQDI